MKDKKKYKSRDELIRDALNKQAEEGSAYASDRNQNAFAPANKNRILENKDNVTIVNFFSNKEGRRGLLINHKTGKVYSGALPEIKEE